MKKQTRHSFLNTLAVSSVLVLLGLTGTMTALAATTPSLEDAATYGVLASTYTNTGAGTTINGDIGFTTGPAVVPAGTHTNYGAGAPYAAAGSAQNTALAALAAQPCTFTFADGAINLSTDVTHGAAGVFTPGVYCSVGAMNIGGPLTLNGSGTYIFRPVGALTSTVGSVVTLSSASACDVFWTPSGATTLAANTTFAGIIIDPAGITIGANTTWIGMALAFGGTVTTDTNTISVPTCLEDVPPEADPEPATLHIIKTVVNSDGASAVSSDFTMHVKFAGDEVSGSPAAGAAAPGTSYSLAAGTYVVTENANASYLQSYSGDCNSSGSVTLAAGEDKTCTITNTYIAPAAATLHIIKEVVNSNGETAVASDFMLYVKLAGVNVSGSPVSGIAAPGTSYALPAGTYTVSEDTNASYTQSFSGDCNASGVVTLVASDDKTCTLTNTSVAVSGGGGGLPSGDEDDDEDPTPLIHVVKTVDRSTPFPFGGGDVTYTYTVTNPGVVELSDVELSDDKCSDISNPSGDANDDELLDVLETWTYTCDMHIAVTTHNIATVEGWANGMRAEDEDFADVAVSTPGFPDTGVPPQTGSAPSSILAYIMDSALLRKRTI